MTTTTEQAKLTVEQLRALLDNIPAVLYLSAFGEPTRLEFISKNIEALTAYRPEQLLEDGELWTDLIHPDDRDEVLASYKNCAQAGRQFEAHYRIMHKDGSVRHIHNIASPLLDEQGRPCRIAGIMTDVSGRKRAEQQLSRTQMLQSIGKLAAGIAHEINTPVQFIGDNLRFLAESFGDIDKLLGAFNRLREDPANEQVNEQVGRVEEEIDLGFLRNEIPQAFEQSLEGIKRVTAIVSAMRDFSRLDERRKCAADINKALESTLVILRNELKYVADVETDFDSNLPKVMCYLDDLHQVFLNLTINAVHSISEKVSAGKIERGRVTVTTGLADGLAVIKIADTGTGIPPEVRDKIFDSFFTTKQPGKGTGQGLSIARSIVVDKHGGSLSFETETGVGTTFIIRLPILGDSGGDNEQEKKNTLR